MRSVNHHVVSCLVGLFLLVGSGQAKTRHFLMCFPGWPGSTEQAQGYLKPFFDLLADKAGWDQNSTTSEYLNQLDQCVEALKKDNANFAVLSYDLLLDNWKKATHIARLRLQGVDKVHYYVVARKGTYTSLEQMKGKTLTGIHLSSHRFLSKVVFATKYDVTRDFQLKPGKTALRSIKAVVRGKQDAVLLDSYERKAMDKLSYRPKLEVVYTSPEIPPLPMVAFKGKSTNGEIKLLQKVLPQICGQAKKVCESMRVEGFLPPDPNGFKALLKQWR